MAVTVTLLALLGSVAAAEVSPRAAPRAVRPPSPHDERALGAPALAAGLGALGLGVGLAAPCVRRTLCRSMRRVLGRGAEAAPVAEVPSEPVKPAAWWKALGADLRPAKPDADRARAAALLRQGRTLGEAERAVELLEGAVARAPEDARVALECAQALNAVMRIKTYSNTLHITRMLDTPAHKKVWAQLGPRALSLSSRAKAGLPGDEGALVAYADAFFFATSTRGVLAAATTGSGLKFKANSKELIQKCPNADGGVGHCYLGAFYLMAPWPLSNAKLARHHLSAAHAIVPSRRNAYYLGVMHYRLGRPSDAAPFFRQAMAAKSASASEADFGGWVLAEAKAALAACEAACARGG